MLPVGRRRHLWSIVALLAAWAVGASAAPLPRLQVSENKRFLVTADKQPFFFFAGIWRPWTGDRGTKKKPNIGDHGLFSIMTTEPNAVVEPIHEKAMPVILMTPEDVEQWLHGVSVDDALTMQTPAPDDAIVIRPDEKKAA